MSLRTGSLGVATTKGDLYTLDATSKIARLPVGTPNQILVVDPALPLGFGWKTSVREVTQNYVPDLSFSDMAVRQINAGAGINVTCPVPVDFGTLVDVGVVMVPFNPGGNNLFTFTSDYGAENAAFDQHSGTHAPVVALVANSRQFVDASPAFAGSPLVAGGGFGLGLVNGGVVTVGLLCVRLRYNPAWP